ncbi:MAG: acetate/propionate family kinase [Pirellula sp.]|nr:acetate/propionate family kinase [Pirellula sp.]
MTMNILLLNAGSSSLKVTVMNAADGKVIARGSADWAGQVTRYQYSNSDGSNRTEEVSWSGHAKAVQRFMDDLPTTQRSALIAVGHRVVHGGQFTTSVSITPQVRERIMALSDLAPLHNPPAMTTLAAAEAALPGMSHVAVFDTAFHATLSPEAYTYPLPQKWTREWGIRRYGFHGLSHAYCAQRAAEMLATRPSDLPSRLVICHLGHGCSASAVKDGKCVDTTMGFTPLDGLMMGTRCGSIDPSIVLHVLQHKGLTVEQVEMALNRESGLLGVSGISGDMRQMLAAAKAGNEFARLAIGIYSHRVRQAIGSFAVTMGGIDALVFTAGVGENAAEIRASVCEGLGCLGLELDGHANVECQPDMDVAVTSSRGRIFVIATQEDVTMVREVTKVLAEKTKDSLLTTH